MAHKILQRVIDVSKSLTCQKVVIIFVLHYLQFLLLVSGKVCSEELPFISLSLSSVFTWPVDSAVLYSLMLRLLIVSLISSKFSARWCFVERSFFLFTPVCLCVSSPVFRLHQRSLYNLRVLSKQNGKASILYVDACRLNWCLNCQ